MAGRPVGAETKHKPFRAALNRAIDSAGSNPKAMDNIARKLLQMAESGDVQAIREVADRLDGKPAQTVGGDPESGPIQIQEIKRVIIDPDDSNGEGV